MEIESKKAIVVSECLGSTLDGIAAVLKEAEFEPPIVDDGIVVTDMELVQKANLTVDLDSYPAVVNELMYELHERLHNESEIDLDTVVVFKL